MKQKQHVKGLTSTAYALKKIERYIKWREGRRMAQNAALKQRADLRPRLPPWDGGFVARTQTRRTLSRKQKATSAGWTFTGIPLPEKK